LVTIMPFWIDSSSFGRPWRLHSLIWNHNKPPDTISTAPEHTVWHRIRHFVWNNRYVQHAFIQTQYMSYSNVLTVGASDNKSAKLSWDVNGISRMARPFSQLLSNLLRNSWLNGPAYDKNPVHMHTSPTSLQCIKFINSNCVIHSINCICQHKCYNLSKIHYSFWRPYILMMLVFIGQNSCPGCKSR